MADFCPVLVYEFLFHQYCLASAMNRSSHVPTIKIGRFRPYVKFHYFCQSQFQNIRMYYCIAYCCYSVRASLRFGPCCPTECGDWENLRVQIGIDVCDFDVLACILYDRHDTAEYKFNNAGIFHVVRL